MKLPLEKPEDVGGAAAFLRDSAPFVTNKVGLLVHRPRRATIYNRTRYCKPHIAIRYHCGNGATGGRDKLAFVSEPPADSLLCQVCEDRAVMAGLPSARDIVGRHVHVGKLRAVQTCCAEAVNE